VSQHRLSLDSSRKKGDRRTKPVPARAPAIAIAGMGRAGLLTALALYSNCPRVIGIDASASRLRAIASGTAGLTAADGHLVGAAFEDGSLELTTVASAAALADAVIVCVPAQAGGDGVPDVSALRRACGTVVAHARTGQTIILTSTAYVGTTRELLVGPLERRGMRAGEDVFVAASPERIESRPDDHPRQAPRVIGGATQSCTERAARVIRLLTDVVHVVSSAEAAEAAEIYQNISRAVTLAVANEFAGICRTLGLDPIEVTAFAGPGAGGDRIPRDPQHLLRQLQLNERNWDAPLVA